MHPKLRMQGYPRVIPAGSGKVWKYIMSLALVLIKIQLQAVLVGGVNHSEKN